MHVFLHLLQHGCVVTVWSLFKLHCNKCHCPWPTASSWQLFGLCCSPNPCRSSWPQPHYKNKLCLSLTMKLLHPLSTYQKHESHHGWYWKQTYHCSNNKTKWLPKHTELWRHSNTTHHFHIPFALRTWVTPMSISSSSCICHYFQQLSRPNSWYCCHQSHLTGIFPWPTVHCIISHPTPVPHTNPTTSCSNFEPKHDISWIAPLVIVTLCLIVNSYFL